MAISWADVLEWETGPLDSIAADLGEVSQGLRSAHATGENALGAIQSEGLAVTMMRATTTSNLESLEQAATNVNDALMAIEGARDGVATIKANAEDAQAYASAHNCTIAADGAVTCTPTDDTDPQAVFEARSAMMTLMYEVASILDDAERVDSELSSALSAISTNPHASSAGVV
ncbi:MAG: alpha/beta hydrolase, partial [Schaalia sp.]|nr:alpha/beta hydrolase [Schaalia sp.]